MNKSQINKTFFEDLYKIQMNEIKDKKLENARKIILNLMLYVQSDARDDIPGKDEAIEEGLKWINTNT